MLWVTQMGPMYLGRTNAITRHHDHSPPQPRTTTTAHHPEAPFIFGTVTCLASTCFVYLAVKGEVGEGYRAIPTPRVAEKAQSASLSHRSLREALVCGPTRRTSLGTSRST